MFGSSLYLWRTSIPILETKLSHGFMFRGSKLIFFRPLSCNFCIVESTLCYQSMMFTHWQTLSSLMTFELIWFCELLFLVGLLWQLWFRRKMIFNLIDSCEDISFFSGRGFWMFSPSGRHVFSSMCQYGVRRKGHWRPSSLSFPCIL